MKSFEYPGGRITLPISADWVEKIEDDEVRLYYRDVPHSGEFRARVRTYKGSKPVNFELMSDILLKMAAALAPDADHKIELLPNGNPIVAFFRLSNEDGAPIVLTSWLVGVAVPPSGIQIASFTHTVSARDALLPEVSGEITMLGEAISRAEYEIEIDDMKPHRKKAWWRRGR